MSVSHCRPHGDTFIRSPRAHAFNLWSCNANKVQFAVCCVCFSQSPSTYMARERASDDQYPALTNWSCQLIHKHCLTNSALARSQPTCSIINGAVKTSMQQIVRVIR
jgi:hypothetical protein